MGRRARSRLRLEGVRPRCRARGPTLGLAFLGRRYTALPDGRVRDEIAGRTITLLPSCRAHTLQTMAWPPRLLVGCRGVRAGSYRFALWKPGVRFTWKARFAASNTILRRRVRFPVIAPRSSLGASTPSYFIDVDSGQRYLTEPLRPLWLAGVFGYRRRLLVQRVKRPAELWVIDFSTGKAERVARRHGCPKRGRLVLDDQRGGRAVISCLSAAGWKARYHDARRLALTRFSEVIDFRRRTRWRTRRVFEARLSGDLQAVGTIRGHPARLGVIVTR